MELHLKGFLWPYYQNSPFYFLHRLNDYLSYLLLLNFFLPNWNVSSKKLGCFLGVYFLHCWIPQKFRTVSDPQETLNNICWLTCGPLLTVLLSGLSPEGAFPHNFPREKSYLSMNNYGGNCEGNKIFALIPNNFNNTLKEQNIITK